LAGQPAFECGDLVKRASLSTANGGSADTGRVTVESSAKNGLMPVSVHKPEVYTPGERVSTPDPWIKHLAYLMDGAIAIGPWSFGIDPE